MKNITIRKKIETRKIYKKNIKIKEEEEEKKYFYKIYKVKSITISKKKVLEIYKKEYYIKKRKGKNSTKVKVRSITFT